MQKVQSSSGAEEKPAFLPACGESQPSPEEIPGGSCPDYAKSILLCFDSWEDQRALGHIHTFYFAEAQPFQGLDELLLALTALMDRAGYPSPWFQCRSIFPKSKGSRPAASHPEPRPFYAPGGLDHAKGKLCTMTLRIFQRQHASIQGVLQTHLVKRALCFRSGMELLALLWELLEACQSRKQT